MENNFYKGRLLVKVSETREAMGRLASAEAVEYIKDLMSKKREVNIIFAAAPSQNDFLSNLLTSDVDWSKVNAFHMDEYVGIASDAPQGFANFLSTRIFSKMNFASVNLINSMAEDPELECERYAALLKKYPIDIVFLGIGENGHLAFNDPHVAFFDDPKSVKIVDIDEVCRQQQVNDGCFESIDQVPTHAFTITMPDLVQVNKLFVIVPTAIKANAIKGTCDGSITTDCPSSILRTHKDATLYIDRDSAGLLNL